MSTSQMEYAVTKELMEDIQRQPIEIRKELLTMLRGGIVISDMYARNQPTPPPRRSEQQRKLEERR